MLTSSRRIRRFAVILMTSFLASFPALAQQPPCGTREEVLNVLSEKYHEIPIAGGLANNGALIQLLTSADGATWTIAMIQPNGFACLLATGENWQARERMSEEQGPQL
jgi:hypothetical protein